MAAYDRLPADVHAPTAPSSEAGASRRRYVDNLKVLLIAGIIVVHAILGYATLEVWTYTGVREVTLSPVVEGALFLLVLPFGLFVIALLFLVAGLLTVPSLQRKGPARFARDRLVRLGVPFAVYVLVVQPALVYALEHPLGVAPGTYWQEFLGDEGEIDTGPLWFVGVLLVYSLGYAAWIGLRGERRAGPGERRVTARHLAVAAGLVAPLSFVVRLVYPYGGDSGVTDLNLWQWPVCVAVFGLGVVACRQSWLDAIPDALRRRCRTVTLVAVVAMMALLSVLGLQDRFDELMGGWGWPAVAFAAVESTLNLFGPVWLLAEAQRHLDRGVRWVGPAVRRSAFGAFVVQTLVLLALAVALRPVPLPAEAKAVLVAAGGVTGSFGLAWLLIRRVPGVGRVL